MKEEVVSAFQGIQSDIVCGLGALETKAAFRKDPWDRVAQGGGGGITCVVENGALFERGGVNFSEVHGELPPDISEKLIGVARCLPFFATGVSLVLHPYSPMIPTVHFNVRYLEVENLRWFGGGSDLTPYYLYEDDAVHFHRSLKTICDRHNDSFFSRFKKWCDEYFYLPHRKEARGVGGIFFDYLGKDNPHNLERYFAFVADLSATFLSAYVPIIERRRNEPWSTTEKEFQLLRRGRYVEFNLIIDRGTLFGLKTGGRTESILVSLPGEVRWEYDYKPAAGSWEAKLIDVVEHPREWV